MKRDISIAAIARAVRKLPNIDGAPGRLHLKASHWHAHALAVHPAGRDVRRCLHALGCTAAPIGGDSLQAMNGPR